MKDQLSALMDGEFDIESAEHLITSAKSGGELKSCWAHYHLIGDALRGDVGRGGIQMSHDFSHRVMSALESEPTVLLPNLDALQPNIHAPSRASSKQAFYKKSTQFWSVAASVAAVMFVGVMVLQQQISQPTEPTAVQVAQQEVLKQQAAEQLTPVEIAQSVPTEYLQAHHAAAPSAGAYYIQTASYTEPQQ
jgi:sigma-E factor negative regulatory protein RseA